MTSSQELQHCLDRLKAGDPTARNILINHAYQRLQELAQRMFKSFPGLKRFANTSDVLHDSVVRLLATLREVSPSSPRDFLNLSASCIRRQLLDMARHYYGPEGAGRHETGRVCSAGPEVNSRSDYDIADTTYEPAHLALLTEVHEQVDALPDEEREAWNLIFYQDLGCAEAAAVAGISVPTMKRRWQRARLRLKRAVKGEMPIS